MLTRKRKSLINIKDVVEESEFDDSESEGSTSAPGSPECCEVFNCITDSEWFLEDAEKTASAPEEEQITAVGSPQRSRKIATPKRKKHVKTGPVTESEGRWKSADELDSEPQQYTFSPSRAPRVHLGTQNTYTPLELFQLFFSTYIVKTLCQNTNKYAKARWVAGKSQPWVDVTETDMYQYIGLLIAMGLVKLKHIDDYWCEKKVYNLPFFALVMPQTKFESISCSIHISDPDSDAANDGRKGTAEYDRLCRLRPLMDDLLLACKAFYQPRQNLSIGARMVALRNRVGFGQKCKFLLFMLADAHNGYTFDFSIYAGKPASASGKVSAYDTVMSLLKTSYLGTGYHVYMYNFYTSTILYESLYLKSFGACGMVQEEDWGFAKEHVRSKQAEMGSAWWFRKGALLFTRWTDTRDVTVCSTIHSASCSGDTVKQRVRNKGGTRAVHEVPVPACVSDHVKFTVGLGLSGALQKPYSIKQKTQKWYRSFLDCFVNIAVVNAYLLHEDMTLARGEKTLTQKEFREELCVQLVEFKPERDERCRTAVASDESSARKPPSEPACTTSANLSVSFRPSALTQHAYAPLCYPTPISDPSATSRFKKAGLQQKYCVHCTKSKKYVKTVWMCSLCKMPLCLSPEQNCFRTWRELQYEVTV